MRDQDHYVQKHTHFDTMVSKEELSRKFLVKPREKESRIKGKWQDKPRKSESSYAIFVSFKQKH